MTINERFRLVRENKGLSMAQFGNVIGLSHSGVSAIEYGTRKVTEKHIKMLLLTFGVDETWLRTGEGEMFVQTDDSILASLAKEYGLDAGGLRLIKAYLNMRPDHRKVLYDFVMEVAQTDSGHTATAPSHPPAAVIEARMDEADAELAESAQNEKEPPSSIG